MGLLKRFWNDQSGGTAIEYTLIIAGIALVIAVAVNQIGVNLRDGAYTEIQDVVQ